MNTIKKMRQVLGYTQEDLAKQSTLSLRTIQRLEASTKAPKGHSLKMLAQVFSLAPTELADKFAPVIQVENSDKTSMKLINLSVLAVFLFPFGNLFGPLLVWSRKRHSKAVDKMGRSIINFQLFWTSIMIFGLIVSPFIDISSFSSTPLILYVLFACLAVNFMVVCLTARAIQRGTMDFLQLPVSLI